MPENKRIQISTGKLRDNPRGAARTQASPTAGIALGAGALC